MHNQRRESRGREGRCIAHLTHARTTSITPHRGCVNRSHLRVNFRQHEPTYDITQSTSYHATFRTFQHRSSHSMSVTLRRRKNARVSHGPPSDLQTLPRTCTHNALRLDGSYALTSTGPTTQNERQQVSVHVPKQAVPPGRRGCLAELSAAFPAQAVSLPQMQPPPFASRAPEPFLSASRTVPRSWPRRSFSRTLTSKVSRVF